MREHGIEPIDLLVVNLYPFEQTIARADATYRRGDREHRYRRPGHDSRGGEESRRASPWSSTRRTTTACSRRCSDKVLSPDDAPPPRRQGLCAHGELRHGDHEVPVGNARRRPARRALPVRGRPCSSGMRYGENPHQAAAFYVDQRAPKGSLATATQLQGKALSYNNIADSDAALECVQPVRRAGLRHRQARQSLRRGGRRHDRSRPTRTRFAPTRPRPSAASSPSTARWTREPHAPSSSKQFVEVIVAPDIDADARRRARAKEERARAGHRRVAGGRRAGWNSRRCRGGLLVQGSDDGRITAGRPQGRHRARADAGADRGPAVRLDGRQVRQVERHRLLQGRHDHRCRRGPDEPRLQHAHRRDQGGRRGPARCNGSVMASDAFFPFRDGIDAAAEAGIAAIIQPGGSMRDDEVIAAADEHGMAMVFTGMRHFRH